MKYFAYLFIAFVIYTILSASMGWHDSIFALVKLIPFSDKIMHVLLLGIFTYCINFLLQFHTFKVASYYLLAGSIIIFILATLEEISQYWIPTRTFDLLDLTANYVGISLATFFILKYDEKYSKT